MVDGVERRKALAECVNVCDIGEAKILCYFDDWTLAWHEDVFVENLAEHFEWTVWHDDLICMDLHIQQDDIHDLVDMNL